MALQDITNKEKRKKPPTELPDDTVEKYKSYQSFIERGCCKEKCIQQITFSHIVTLQRNFRAKSERDRRQFLLDFFHGQANTVFGSLTFMVEGFFVCRSCWMFANDVKHSLYFGILSDVRRLGRTDASSCRSGRVRSMASQMAQAWLERYALESGDHAPNEKRVYLSSCLTKLDLYRLYKLDMDSEITEAVSYETFTAVWRQECAHITPRQNSNFSKCGVCEILRESEKSSTDIEFKKWVRESKKKHVEQQQAERRVYYRHRKKARDFPDRYASLILDGMDQNKTNLPHFTSKSKTYRSEMYRVHVTGAISHGTNENFIFLDEMEWPHDSDQTMNTLLLTLWKISKSGQLPPVLYLQMDNCWRENKNQFVLGFCALLVQLKVVRKIRLSFLMVGHTHEDIDQRFSRIADALNHHDTVTLTELKTLIGRSFSPAPEVSSLVIQYAIRDWLKPYLNPPKNHTKPHAFKFELDATGNVEVSYRMWAAEKDWLGKIDLLRGIPSTLPPLLRPTYEKQTELEDVERDISSCAGKITLKQMKKWQKFIRRGRKMREYWQQASLESHFPTGKWLLSEFLPYRAVRKTPDQFNADDQSRQEVLGAMLNKENAVVKVSVTYPKENS